MQVKVLVRMEETNTVSPLQALVGKNLPANVGDKRDVGSISGLGRSPRGGHGNPLQCSCLENPMDRGAWWAAVYGVAQSRTRLEQLSSSSSSREDVNEESYGGNSLETAVMGRKG